MPLLSEYDLSGQVAILATSGGDEAPFLAQALAEAGASVFPVARNQSNLVAVLNTLPAGSPGATVGRISLAAVISVMEQFDRAYDRVDILVNDARSIYAAPFADIRETHWDEIQSRNAKLPFLLCQQVLPRMAAREYGRIVNLISELAERGMINGSVYCAAQAGVLNLTRALALEWARSGITVNAIGAGWTDGMGLLKDAHIQEQLVRYLPHKRLAQPHEIGEAAVYLASDKSGFITGQTVWIEGGALSHL